MLLTNWVPRILTGQQSPDSDFASGGGYDIGQAAPDPSAQTTLMGAPLSQLQPQNYYPNFTVNGLLTDTPGVVQTNSPYPDVPPILGSSSQANQALAITVPPPSYWTSLAANGPAKIVRNAQGGASNMGARTAFGETRGMYPQQSFPSNIYNMDSWDPASATDLNTARAWLAEVQTRNPKVNSVDLPSGSNSLENNQWQQSVNAVKNAGNLSPSDVGNFFIRQNGVGRQAPDYVKGAKPYMSFGPFINTGGGDAPRGKATYIDFYKGFN